MKQKNESADTKDKHSNTRSLILLLCIAIVFATVTFLLISQTKNGSLKTGTSETSKSGNDIFLPGEVSAEHDPSDEAINEPMMDVIELHDSPDSSLQNNSEENFQNTQVQDNGVINENDRTEIDVSILNPENFSYEETYDDESYYRNDRVLKYSYGDSGDYISVGIKTDNTDRLILNLQASVATFTNPIIFYADAERCAVSCSSDVWSSYVQDNNKGHSCFIANWTMDQLKFSEYLDQENFGCCWRNDYLIDGQYHAGDTLLIRAFDLHTQCMITAFYLFIDYDSESSSYFISGMADADECSLGGISSSDYKALISDSLEFLSNADLKCVNHQKYSIDFLNYALSHSTVIKTDHVFFKRWMDLNDMPHDETIIFGLSDIYAVVLNTPGNYSSTLYYSSDLEKLNEIMGTEYCDSKNTVAQYGMICFGMDPPNLYSKASVGISGYFDSDLLASWK